MVDYIKSPKTGRDITVGGPAYEALMGTRYEAQALRARRFKKAKPGSRTKRGGRVTPVRKIRKLPKAKPRSLSRTLADVPASRKARRKVLKGQISRKGKGRGSRTRGWAAAAPQRGRERHELLDECGDECFLLPEREAFPICAALREGQGCKVDCRGVTAAKVRAAQWKYPEVYSAASHLEEEYECARKAPRRTTSKTTRKAPRKTTRKAPRKAPRRTGGRRSRRTR